MCSFAAPMVRSISPFTSSSFGFIASVLPPFSTERAVPTLHGHGLMRALVFSALLLSAISISAQQPQVQLVRLVGGLDQPVAITNAGDSRLFITQQSGKIVIW